MKNLKRALSLVLTTAMLVGMMVVGTGAAYTDVKAEHNEEAIAVVAAAGIMGAGDKFNPDGELTRGEMAVIMVNMLDLDVKDYKGAANFVDAGWAAEYIDACYANGIMAGISATEFGTNVKVTTAQAALMMQKALGYFQNAADFGQDWQLATIKNAAKIDLLEGIDAKASEALTRNEVAQLALNALKADVVDLNDDATSTTITAGDVQVSIAGNNKYEPQTTSADHYDLTADEAVDCALDKDADCRDHEQLIEKLFEDITKADTTDAYGRAAIEWLNDDESIIVVGEAADYTFVITEDTTLAEYIEDEKLDKKIKLADDEDMDLVAGQVVELWVNKDKELECDPVVYNYVIGQITEIEEVDEDLEEDEIEAGAKYWVTIDIIGEAVLDIQIDGFDAETFVEDAYVVMPEIAPVETEYTDDLTADKYQDVTVAESFEGKVTAIGADYIRVDGSKTNVLAAAVIDKDGEATDIAVKTEYTFYKDVNGVILLAAEVKDADDEVKLDDVVVLLGTYSDDSKDKYGRETTTTYAQIMNMEGEVEDVIICIEKEDETFGTTDYVEMGLYTAKEYTAKKVIDEINYKGTTKLTDWADEDYAVIETGAVEVEKDDKKIGDVRLNSKVTFILVEGEMDEIETEVKAGKQNITLTEDAFIIAEVDDDDNEIAVYVIVPDGEFSNKDEYKDVIYFDADADTEAVVVEIDDEDYDAYTVDAYTEAGKAITLTLDDTYESGFYTYSIEDGIFTLEAVEAYDAEEEQDGELAGEYTGKYGTLATIGGEEIETADATWIDLHDDEEGYPKSIKTLAALAKAVDNEYTVDLTVYVKDDAAVVIVVR